MRETTSTTSNNGRATKQQGREQFVLADELDSSGVVTMTSCALFAAIATPIILRILLDLICEPLPPVKHLKNISRLVGTQVVLPFLSLAAFLELNPHKVRVRRRGGTSHLTLFVS